MIIIAPDAWRSQPWKNGAGTTHEIVRWPDDDSFTVRISVADVTAPAPFSTFPDLDRWLYLLAGGPVVLALPDGERVLRDPGDGVAFPGEAIVAATRVDRASRDLNFMVRRDRSARGEIVRGPSNRTITGAAIAVFAIAGSIRCEDAELSTTTCAWQLDGRVALDLAPDAIAAILVVD